MQQVTLEIDLIGSFYNHWPYLIIKHNNAIIFDSPVESSKTLAYELQCEVSNTLTFVHYGKQFGENSIWDKDSITGQECSLSIEDIRLNAVSIDHLKSNLVFNVEWSDWVKSNNWNFAKSYEKINSNGVMVFNGSITFCFETPVYDWLILKKYKTESRSNAAYFSNYTDRWHYDEDIAVINEIKNLMNENSSC